VDARTRDERLKQIYQESAPVVNADTFARHVAETTKGKKPKTFGTAHPRRRVALGALAVVVVLGLIGFGVAELVTSSGRDGAVVVITDDSMSPGVTSAGTETTAGATDSTTSDDYWPVTTSSTTLFPQQHSFMQEASKDGYNVFMFTKQEGDMKVLVVWVIIDNGEMTREATDAIFDYIAALAEKYDAAEAAGGRMRVELSDAPPGEIIKDYIFESRDFELDSEAQSQPVLTPTTSTTTTAIPSGGLGDFDWPEEGLEPEEVVAAIRAQQGSKTGPIFLPAVLHQGFHVPAELTSTSSDGTIQSSPNPGPQGHGGLPGYILYLSNGTDNIWLAVNFAGDVGEATWEDTGIFFEGVPFRKLAGAAFLQSVSADKTTKIEISGCADWRLADEKYLAEALQIARELVRVAE